MRLAHLFVPEHEIGEASLLGFLDHGLDLMVLSFVVLDAWERRLDLLQEAEQFLRNEAIS